MTRRVRVDESMGYRRLHLASKTWYSKGMQDFRKLRVWNQAQALAVAVYRASSEFPTSERFGLTAQMRRAAVSVSSNIAEGCGLRGPSAMSHYIQIAIGSCCELDSQLDLARQLNYLMEPTASGMAHEVDTLRRSLISLQSRIDSQRSHANE